MFIAPLIVVRLLANIYISNDCGGISARIFFKCVLQQPIDCVCGVFLANALHHSIKFMDYVKRIYSQVINDGIRRTPHNCYDLFAAIRSHASHRYLRLSQGATRLHFNLSNGESLGRITTLITLQQNCSRCWWNCIFPLCCGDSAVVLRPTENSATFIFKVSTNVRTKCHIR